MNTPQNSYDAVPYDSSPFWQTHPDRMATLGRLCGMTPADPTSCRVLELGCGLGGNLIPMALVLPESQFLGIDLSGEQIKVARAEADALGLTNIEFRQADILELDEPQGSFDFMICHGVYSWVPRPVQDRILEQFRTLLGPQGIAFVSYNTKPGWGMRGMIRDLMRYHTAQFEDPAQKIAQARAVLNYVARETQSQEQSPYALFLAKELALVSGCSDTYLFHEHLEANNEAIYFQEFADRLDDAGLRYLGGAGVGDLWTTLFPGRGNTTVTRGGVEYVRLEQYRDFVNGRHFRMSLVVGKDVALREQPDWTVVRGFFVAAPSPAESEIETHPEWSEVSALTKAAVRELGKTWPQPVLGGTLHAAAQARAEADGQGADESEQVMIQGLLRLFAAGQIELRPRRLPFVTRVGERPRACPYVQHQARREDASYVTSRRHDPIPVNNYLRRLLLLLDGTRDREQLVTELVELAANGTLSVSGPDEAPVTDPETLTETFRTNLETQFLFMGNRALLIE